jgi:hypothetical protein
MANSTAAVCKTMPTTSNGVWQGDVPIHFALPLIIIQILLVVTVSRTLAFFFKPLKQPRVIAEVVVRNFFFAIHSTMTNFSPQRLFI